MKVVLPGPNHPSKIKGSVAVAQARSGGDEVEQAQAEFMAARDPRQPVPGAIPGARVVFEKDGNRVEVTGNQQGRFRARLAPGDWSYTARADGFREARGHLLVPVRREPIYQEEARMVGPDEVAERDVFGLPCSILLER